MFLSARVVGWVLIRTSQIENDALYGHDSSYTCDILRPAYQACNLESGKSIYLSVLRILY
jgi:hypothetical protein